LEGEAFDSFRLLQLALGGPDVRPTGETTAFHSFQPNHGNNASDVFQPRAFAASSSALNTNNSPRRQ
jgi:hypothetical protein